MSASFPALGTTATVVMAEPGELGTAVELLRAELDAIDRTCSRFRSDSEISRLHQAAGRAVEISPLLAEALEVALRAARLTSGLVDPTVGAAVQALGYDRDFASMRSTIGGREPLVAAPGWHRVRFDPTTATVVLPHGVQLDLGATAKAFAADRAAQAIARRTGCGTLVNLGGDISIAGPTRPGGWHVAIGADHTNAVEQPETIVTLYGGGLATSGTTRRRWLRAGRPVHHIVDPRTGDIPIPHWRTASVAALSCVDANTASTAAVILGEQAAGWLAGLGLPARLVALNGTVRMVAGWPDEDIPLGQAA